MIVIYLGILAVGIMTIVFILSKEKKGSKPSAVDLLNSLEVDENPGEEQKTSHKTPSSNFVNRLNLNGRKTKKTEGLEKPISPQKPLDAPDLKQPIKNNFEQSAEKVKLNQENNLDKTSNDNN